jgi:hypothetical protein
LQIPTFFGVGEKYFSQLLKVRGVNDVRQTKTCIREPSFFQVEIPKEFEKILIKLGRIGPRKR